MRAVAHPASFARHPAATGGCGPIAADLARPAARRPAAPALVWALGLVISCPPLLAGTGSAGETGDGPAAADCRLADGPGPDDAVLADRPACPAPAHAALALRLMRSLRLTLPLPAHGASAGPPAAALPSPVAEAPPELARQLLHRLGLVRLRGDRLRPATVRWSLGIETEGPLRWSADVFADERSGTWLSTGIAWPLADAVTVNLARAQALRGPQPLRQPRWTLGLSLAF